MSVKIIDIPNGTPVYGALIEHGEVARFAFFCDDSPVLRVGLSTLAHILAEGQRCMDQARTLADARAEESCRS